MRKYTIDEIEDMREAVTTLGGSTGAEDRLRTYMQNETEPKELTDAARRRMDPIMERQRMLQKQSERWTADASEAGFRSGIFSGS